MSEKMKAIKQGHRSFAVSWSDGSVSELPFIWLRDNDPGELHPQTHERTFDLTSVPLDIQPRSHRLDNDLIIQWPDRDVASVYTEAWIFAHRPGHGLTDPARISKKSWPEIGLTQLPRFNAEECANNKSELLAALKTLKTSGIILIENLEDELMAGERFGDLIGFKRESNYGVMFEVISKPDPNNLAYTSLELPLHTDLANQENIPGNQFLHCYRNSASGGGSRFADALAIVNEFKNRHDQYYQLLCELQVPWRFIDEQTDLRQHRPVIGLNRDGSFKGLTFNAHLADVPDFKADIMYDFYAAFQALMKAIRSSEFNLEYELKPGEMVIFDNQRILHGRASFDPESGQRHLRGYYIEHNEIDNRIRILSK